MQEWDGSLEVMAQETAESCEFIKERGTNVFYNTTRLPQDMLEVFNLVLEPWQSSQDAQQVHHEEGWQENAFQRP